MNIVAIIIIVICGLLALFNFINLYYFARRFFTYWRHPDRDFLKHVSEVAARTAYCPDCHYRGRLAWQGESDHTRIERLPDREIFYCDQCGSANWEFVTDE